MKLKNGLFLFHRDLRIIDNRGLIEASKLCEHLYTAFIFTPIQVSAQNSYRSENSIQMMIESLEDLQKCIEEKGGSLLCFYGNTDKVIEYCLKKLSIDGVYFNEDITPFAKERSKQLKDLCKKQEISCESYHDYYLHPPGTVLTDSGTTYHKFSPFYEKSLLDFPVLEPNRKTLTNFKSYTKDMQYSITLSHAKEKFLTKINHDLLVTGGRPNALQQLSYAIKTLKDYKETRDSMSVHTSLLSAYIKYGNISIREAYYGFLRKYGKFHDIIRQFIWRDFFANILYFYPENLGNLYSQKLKKKFKWSKSERLLNAWKDGKTGVPLIDAGMRELNTTGYMHNRCRMLVASYLVKILHIDWREGEKYFARQLVDYDVASNSGNWQSIVGAGVYAMPYFRVMSPWAQSKDHDHNCEYIKQWIPELKNIDSKVIHKWYKYCNEPPYKGLYICPIVDYKKQRDVFLDMMN